MPHTASFISIIPLRNFRHQSSQPSQRHSRRTRQSNVCASNSTISPEPTPLVPITVRGRTFYIKRDDVLNHAGVTASKLRKFHSLFLPGTLADVDYVVSYGGAQSNAMLALARLCHSQSTPFIYITRTVPRRVANTNGNFTAALQVGMHHLALSNDQFREQFTDRAPCAIQSAALAVVQSAPSLSYLTQSLLNDSDEEKNRRNPLFIPQGGAWCGAEYGVRILASELRTQIDSLRSEGGLANKTRPVLFLPSGTGTTAFFLQKHLGDVAKIVTIPVSGDERYLIKQMLWLADSDRQLNADTTRNPPSRDSATSDAPSHQPNSNETKSTTPPTVNTKLQTASLPDVLRPRLRASFADVRPEKLLLWQELSRACQGAFEFDLIYAPKAWEEVLFAIEESRLANHGEDVLYYHSGGIEGNISMLDRFRSEGLLS